MLAARVGRLQGRTHHCWHHMQDWVATGRTACFRTPATSTTDRGLVRKLRLMHIMLPLDKQAQLDDLQQQLKDGASFSELARQHSICPSGKRDGQLGWMSAGQLLPGFESVFAQQQGTERQLNRVTTARGHHLVKVLEEKVEAEVQHMSVQKLQEVLGNPRLCEDVQFVDVREQGEYQLSHLPRFKLLPLSEASSWAPSIQELLDSDKETVILCHHGVRSMQMAMFLVSKGFKDVKNVTGGIAAYSMIDPSVPEY